MTDILEILTITAAAIFAIPTAVVFIETVAAALWGRFHREPATPDRPPCGILMPAHNESGVIELTLQALVPHLRRDDQILVIADNCTDDTADVARRFPVTVIERSSETQRGKGYALAHGLTHWGAAIPEVVVVMDADCWIMDGTLDKIVASAASRQCPAQAIYLMEYPADPSPRDQISAFAFLFKNQVRPLGLHQLGQPCLLTGTGMAFPSRLLSADKLATGNIVEDMQLGLDLSVQGSPPVLVPDARVWGRLPQLSTAATSQRTRWEHGHIQTLVTQMPRLFKQGLRQRRLDLIALAFEMSVPPLSLLVMLWAGATLASLICYALTAQTLALSISLSSGLLLLSAILLAWWQFGRAVLPWNTLLKVPFYLGGKIPLYLKYVTGRQRDWVRTQRD